MNKFETKKINLLTFVLIILLFLFLNNNITYCTESDSTSTIIKDINYLNSLQPDFSNVRIRQHLRSLYGSPLYNQAIEYYKECIFIKKENPDFVKSELHKMMLDNKKEIILDKIRFVPPNLYYDVHRSILHMDLLADCVKNFCSDI
jgi:hypothetical protein